MLLMISTRMILFLFYGLSVVQWKRHRKRQSLPKIEKSVVWSAYCNIRPARCWWGNSLAISRQVKSETTEFHRQRATAAVILNIIIHNFVSMNGASDRTNHKTTLSLLSVFDTISVFFFCSMLTQCKHDAIVSISMADECIKCSDKGKEVSVSTNSQHALTLSPAGRMILWNVTVVLAISMINEAKLWYRNELTSKCQQSARVRRVCIQCDRITLATHGQPRAHGDFQPEKNATIAYLLCLPSNRPTTSVRRMVQRQVNG